MKNLQKVVAVRHGYYDSEDGSLTEDGKQQAKALAQAIATATQGFNNVALLASPAKRTQETAKIISEVLGGVNCQICKSLAGDRHREWEFVMKEITPIIDNQDVLIAVTHFTLPSGIIHAFSQERFQKPFGSKEIEGGTGIVLCLKTGALYLIP